MGWAGLGRLVPTPCGFAQRMPAAPEFFSAPVLAIYSCPEPAWSECNQSNVAKTVIDDVSGPFFSVESVDLNLDG